MNDEIELITEETRERMEKALEHLEHELARLRAGRSNPALLDGVTVAYYGVISPLAQVSNINTPDAKTILIQPWEKNMLQAIERSIIAANIGVTPQNDGSIIRIFLPPLTEERRKEIVKRVMGEGENSKIAIRNIRRDAIEGIKKLEKNGLSEDIAADAEKEVQDITNKFIALVEKHLASKEKEIMSV